MVSSRDDSSPSRGIERKSPSVYGCLGLSNRFSTVADLDDPAGVHDGDHVGILGDHAQIVRDQQNRHARLALQFAEQFENLRLDGDIQRGRRFIGDQQLVACSDSAMAIITRWRMPPDIWCG